jgi:predicted DNA-binding transcriptional regulator AlpA
MSKKAEPPRRKAKSKPADTPPAALADDQVVRLAHAPKYFGVGRTKLAEMIQKGAVPKPLRFGPRCVGWLGRTIHDYQEQLKSK